MKLGIENEMWKDFDENRERRCYATIMQQLCGLRIEMQSYSKPEPAPWNDQIWSSTVQIYREQFKMKPLPTLIQCCEGEHISLLRPAIAEITKHQEMKMI